MTSRIKWIGLLLILLGVVINGCLTFGSGSEFNGELIVSTTGSDVYFVTSHPTAESSYSIGPGFRESGTFPRRNRTEITIYYRVRTVSDGLGPKDNENKNSFPWRTKTVFMPIGETVYLTIP